MVREAPVLIPDTTIEEAQTCFDQALLDRYDVHEEAKRSIQGCAVRMIDTSGRPNAFQRMRTEPRVIDANDPDSVLQDARTNMAVLVNDGTRVGVVERLVLDDHGRRQSVVVVYGRLAKRRKIVDGGLVDLVDEGVVLLSIDFAAFKALPDD